MSGSLLALCMDTAMHDIERLVSHLLELLPRLINTMFECRMKRLGHRNILRHKTDIRQGEHHMKEQLWQALRKAVADSEHINHMERAVARLHNIFKLFCSRCTA